MKTALILGAAAVGAYALWRMYQSTAVVPGGATGDAAASMTPTARARTTFGAPIGTRGLRMQAGVNGMSISVGPQPYASVLGDVAARQFAPLATTDSPSTTRYSEVGIRGVNGTAPAGTPRGLGDPSDRVN